MRVNGGEIGNRMATLGKSDPNISKVQNIIGSQKECLRASAVVNPRHPLSFCESGPGPSLPLFRSEKELDFFFFVPFFPPWFPFPFRQVDFFPAHRWADLIRTFLSDLFTMGRWLYLWPIQFWIEGGTKAGKKKNWLMVRQEGWVNMQSSSQVTIYPNEFSL